MDKQTLFLQVSNKLVNEKINILDLQYRNLIYETYSRLGYYKFNAHCEEIPMWMAYKAYDIPPDYIHYIINVQHTIDHLNSISKPTNVYISVMDSNKLIYESIFEDITNPKISLIYGGYTDLNIYNGIISITKEEINTEGYVDYSIFNGSSTIPRLTLSKGCYNNCKFCSNIPSKVVEHKLDIILQHMQNIHDNLKFKLIYIDDKTFGQAHNYQLLYEFAKMYPDTKYIVQTTPKTLNNLLACNSFERMNIFAVEIGVEQYSNEVLKAMNKDSRTEDIDLAAELLFVQKVFLIPNIMVNTPWDTKHSIQATLNYLRYTKHLFANIYSYVDYNDPNKSKAFEIVNNHTYNTFLKQCYSTLNC